MENQEFSEETIKDLLQLIEDPKLEVKKSALCLILQFTTTKENRAHFLHTNILKLLLKSLTQQGLETICLSNLINFSEDQEFCSQLICSDIIHKLIHGIKDIVVIQLGNDLLQMEEKNKLQIELSLLLMSNLCQKIEGIQYFLQLESSETKGIYFKMLCELFCNQKFEESFHFFGNILANISSQEIGRKCIIELYDKDFMKKIPNYLFSNNLSRRLGVLKLMRNCLFEFEIEAFQKEICNSDLIDIACKYLLNLLIKRSNLQGLLEIQKLYALPDENLFTQISQNEIEEYELALDLILIQTNIPSIEKIANYQKDALQQIMEKLQIFLSNNEELKDKIMVILTVFNL